MRLVYPVQLPRARDIQCGAWSSCSRFCSWPLLSPSCPSWCGFFFISLWSRAVLLVFRSFSEWVALCVLSASVCLWVEVSSGCSYSAIFSVVSFWFFFFLNGCWFWLDYDNLNFHLLIAKFCCIISNSVYCSSSQLFEISWIILRCILKIC